MLAGEEYHWASPRTFTHIAIITKSIQLPFESMRDSVKDWMNIAMMMTGGNDIPQVVVDIDHRDFHDAVQRQTIATVIMAAPNEPVVRAAST